MVSSWWMTSGGTLSVDNCPAPGAEHEKSTYSNINDVITPEWHKRMKKTVYRFLWVLVAALVLTATIYPGPVRTAAADDIGGLAGALNYATVDTNNSSIVLWIVYGKTSFLLTGDAEQDEEREIIDSGAQIESTVLNKKIVMESREEIIEEGYAPCKKCKP